jgi:nucleoside-diphosphate-sugar epimerase
MRVFVTGASGHIGLAVVAELLSARHHVVGLARSASSADKIKATGAEVLRGDLDDIDGLCAAAKAADGVIHLGYKHDLAFGGAPDGFVKAAQHDVRVVLAMGEALVGSNKPARRPELGHPASADRAQLARPPRLRADVRRRGAQERLLGLRG